MKRISSLFLAVAVVAALCTQTAFAADILAKPTSSSVIVNDRNVAFNAYNINENNYFKLRDIAAALNESDKSFSVRLDAADNVIKLESGKSYILEGGELAAGDGASKTAVPGKSPVQLDGKSVALQAYNIAGNNYFKLRDLMEKLDVYVGWDGAKNLITIDTSKKYEVDAPVSDSNGMQAADGATVVRGVNIGGSVEDAIKVCGAPTEVLEEKYSESGMMLKYYIFASDYRNLRILDVRDGKVASMFLMSDESVKTSDEISVKKYSDTIGVNGTYATKVMKDDLWKGEARRVPSDFGVQEKILFHVNNGIRALDGLNPLKYSETAAAAARAHSADMAKRNYFDHNSPEGKNAGSRLAALGSEPSSWSENIYKMNFDSDAYDAAAGWYNSDGHRKNILSTVSTQMGCGFAAGTDYKYATQVFCGE